MLTEGTLSAIEGNLLRYEKDYSYDSPSTPGVDISGGSKNGWEVWRDAQNHPAQNYRHK